MQNQSWLTKLKELIEKDVNETETVSLQWLHASHVAYVY